MKSEDRTDRCCPKPCVKMFFFLKCWLRHKQLLIRQWRNERTTQPLKQIFAFLLSGFFFLLEKAIMKKKKKADFESNRFVFFWIWFDYKYPFFEKWEQCIIHFIVFKLKVFFFFSSISTIEHLTEHFFLSSKEEWIK